MIFMGLSQKSIHWTNHSKMKMRFYGFSESRIKRILRTPKRVETGVADGTIAMMQSAGTLKNPYEVWVMIEGAEGKGIKIISAWKYPGKTKPRSEAIMNILNNEYSEYDDKLDA